MSVLMELFGGRVRVVTKVCGHID